MPWKINIGNINQRKRLNNIKVNPKDKFLHHLPILLKHYCNSQVQYCSAFILSNKLSCIRFFWLPHPLFVVIDISLEYRLIIFSLLHHTKPPYF